MQNFDPSVQQLLVNVLANHIININSAPAFAVGLPPALVASGSQTSYMGDTLSAAGQPFDTAVLNFHTGPGGWVSLMYVQCGGAHVCSAEHLLLKCVQSSTIEVCTQANNAHFLHALACRPSPHPLQSPMTQHI